MENSETENRQKPRIPTNHSARLSNASGKRSIRPIPKQSNYQSNSRQSSRKSNIESRQSIRSGINNAGNNQNMDQEDFNDQNQEGRMQDYEEDEEDFVCSRFPHLDFCACKEQCTIAVIESQTIELFNNVFIGDFVAGLSIKKMLRSGITHVLNLTATEYKKRTKYFKYLSIDVYDKSDEDLKKHFRISNRFISEALQSGGKILIQDIDGFNIAPTFALAFLINNEKLPLKNGFEVIRQQKPDILIKPNFWKQLERYDLEKLALVTLNRKE